MWTNLSPISPKKEGSFFMAAPIETSARYIGPFYSMSQRSASAIWETDPSNPRQKSEWARSLAPLERAQHRATRELIFELLDVRSYQEIRDLLQDEKRITKVRQRGYMRAGTMYGIEGEEREVERKIDGYAQIADSVIERVKDEIMQPYAPYLEMTNEVISTNNPADLLLLAMDERFDRKLRFEAARKLSIMDLVASIDRREGEIDTESKFNEFIRDLDEHVWSKNRKIGTSTPTYLLSDHDPETFRCIGVQIFKNTDIPTTPNPGQKVTYLRRRSFESGRKPSSENGEKFEYDVYVTERKKRIEDGVIKMLRKGIEDPAAAVDDNMGLIAVFDEKRQLEIFYRHLMRAMARTGSLIAYEDISDTLSGNPYDGKNVGSSEDLMMRKFFVKYKGMRVEIVLHTNQTYLNERYQRGVAHQEYEISRVFDTGVIELLFPYNIYKLNMSAVKDDLLIRARKRIEDPTVLG